MSDNFLGEIKMISFNFPPKGWAFCNGQLMAINQNQALFSLLGTTFGGNGVTTFALPNLQGRVPIHVGNGLVLGQAGGEASHTLTVTEMPSHTHAIQASSADANQVSPERNLWANGNVPAYSGTAGSTMNPQSVSPVGGSQPHDNMSPFFVVNFVIALQGIFPSQN